LLLVSGLGVGGAEAVVLKLAKGLAEHGRKVIVVALKDEQRILKIVDATGLDIRVLGLTSNPLTVFKGLRQLWNIVAQEGVKVVHAHLVHALYLGLLVKARYRNTKLVFTSHNYAGYPFPRSLIVRFTRYFRDADVLLGPDQHPEINAPNAVIVANGVTVDPQKNERHGPAPDKPFVFLYLSRLTHEKNPDVLIRSAMQIRDQFVRDGTPRSFEVWIAGDGPENENLQQLSESMDGSGTIRFLGMRSDVKDLHQQVHAFVLPSKWEGLPLAVLEAGASALPVIASPVGAIPWLLENERGYLVEPPELSSAMLQVMDNYGEALRRGTLLYEMVSRQFDERLCVSRHNQLYSELTSVPPQSVTSKSGLASS